jgi:hypothetical protein
MSGDGSTDDVDTDDKPADDVDKDTDTDDKPDNKPADDKPDLGDSGKKAIDAMKRERNAALKQLNELRTKVKEFEDKDKTEAQRLSEAADDAKSRAATAETNHRKLVTAMERAPEGATLAQIRAVAKRLTGDTDEDMEADADDLYALLAPKSSESDADNAKAPAGKPKVRLRGGGDPDNEPEEMDPRKLADLIGRP